MNTMNKSKLFIMSVLMISLLFTLCLSDTATAEIYKWIDEHGKTHYTDSPPHHIKSAKKLEKIPTYNIRPQSSVQYGDNTRDAGGTSSGEAINREESKHRRTHEVELYVTSWCTYCKKARKFFQSRGIPVTEYDIEKDDKAALRKKRLDSKRGVPFAVINGHRIHGYVPSAYKKALQDG